MAILQKGFSSFGCHDAKPDNGYVAHLPSPDRSGSDIQLGPTVPVNEALLQPGVYTEIGIELEDGEAMSNDWMWLSAGKFRGHWTADLRSHTGHWHHPSRMSD
jgi:hypothetical protein